MRAQSGKHREEQLEYPAAILFLIQDDQEIQWEKHITYFISQEGESKEKQAQIELSSSIPPFKISIERNKRFDDEKQQEWNQAVEHQDGIMVEAELHKWNQEKESSEGNGWACDFIQESVEP